MYNINCNSYGVISIKHKRSLTDSCTAPQSRVEALESHDHILTTWLLTATQQHIQYCLTLKMALFFSSFWCIY